MKLSIFLLFAFFVYVVGALLTTLYLTIVYFQAKREGPLEPHEELSFGELAITVIAWPYVMFMLLID